MAEPLGSEVAGGAAGRTDALVAVLRRIDSPLAGRLRTGRDLAAGLGERGPGEGATWSRTLPALTALLPAGLPRGELVELVGRRGSGRAGFGLALLAAVTGAGENAVLVDLGDGLDPQGAAAAGVALERLLWARPRRLKETLAAAEAALAGGFPLVLVDLGLPPVAGGRGHEAQWLRLARAAREPKSALVVSAPYRTTGVAAAAVLELTAPRPRWLGRGAEPRLLDGVDARLALARGHGIAPAGAGRADALRLAAG